MRQSPWLTGLHSSFTIWTLLGTSFTACNPELAILISLKLLRCISCSLDGDLFLSRVQYRFSTLDYRILLVKGFGNGTSTKTIAGISLPNCATECAKKPTGTWENTIFNIHLKTWAMWFSNLFMVFSFQFIQLIASCRGSSRAHYRTLTGSIVRKLLCHNWCQSLTKNPRALSLCATDVP